METNTNSNDHINQDSNLKENINKESKHIEYKDETSFIKIQNNKLNNNEQQQKTCYHETQDQEHAIEEFMI